MGKLRSFVWPTEGQEMLLDIALGPQENVVATFEKWNAATDLDKEFDWGTFRLLPLVYERLRSLDLHHPLMGRLKGIYRLAFYETQSIVHVAASMLSNLHAAGIPTMMIKGVPLALSYYRSPAVRPMRDFDFAIPPSMAHRAVAIVEAQGWTRLGYCRDEDLLYRHSMPFRNAAGKEMDLHWHCLVEDGSKAANDWFWARSTPLIVGPCKTLQPDATALLLHTILHGLRSNPEPPVRWVADATRLIESSPGVDWDELVRFAIERRLTHRLSLGLNYLKRRFNCAIPEDTIARLKSQRPSLLEKIENTVFLGDLTTIAENPFGRRWVKFIEYTRMVRIWPLGQVIAQFPDYMRYRADLPHKRNLLPYLASYPRRGLKRLATRHISGPAKE
jgi:hypothetical protein